MTPWIAGYAALVATAAFLWQVYLWRQNQKPRVSVKLSTAIPINPQVRRGDEWLQITVINGNDYSIRVSSAGIYLQDGSGRQVVATASYLPMATLPGDIRPHDSGFTYLVRQELEREQLFNPYGPVEAWAILGDDKRVESKAVVLFKK